MSFAFRCTESGIIHFADKGANRCPDCGGIHESWETGHKVEQGFPNVIGDELPKHYDWQLGCEITSKSRRRKICEEKGFVLRSVADERSEYGGMRKTGGSYSYKGQTNRKSSAERSGVRTKTGQLVI